MRCRPGEHLARFWSFPFSSPDCDNVILNRALPYPLSPIFSEVWILKALRARITGLRIRKELGERNAEVCEGLATSS